MKRKVKVPLDAYGNTVEKEVIDKEVYESEVPGKTSKAYTKFVKGTAGDLKKTKQTKETTNEFKENEEINLLINYCIYF